MIVPLLSTTACIFNIRNSKPNYSLPYIYQEINVGTIELARIFWIKNCQGTILSDLEEGLKGKGRYKRLNLKRRSDGIFIVRGRSELWNGITK